MRRASPSILVAALAAAVAGCVGVPAPSALDLRLDFPDVRVLTPQWRTLVVDPERRAYRPIERSGSVFDPGRGLVYVGTSQGRFLALDTGTGAVAWVHEETDGFFSTPILLDDPEAVVAGSDGGNLIALVPETGATLWTANLGGTIRTRPVFDRGVIYVRTTTQRVFAIEAVSGRELWSFERPLPEGYLSGSESGVCIEGDRVFTGFVDGTLVALSAVTGEKDWDLNLAGEGHGELLLDDVCATPVMVGGLLVVTSYDNGVFAVSPEDGGQRWARSDLPHSCGIGALAEDVFVAVSGTGLARLDALDGATVWMRRFPAGTLRDPIVHGGLILVPDDVHGLVVFEALTGELLQTAWVGAGVAGVPAVLDGRAATIDNTGEFLSYFLAGG
ncbi:MAG: PQQ-binding-like beta-propeller repeat protein [Deltaproteobacteria bacterium]|nr:PQQ-binding-like beta-propeller repeat protein [Deltaproteobacteria bacterium]